MNIMIANYFNLFSLHYICKVLLEYKTNKTHIHKIIFIITLTLLCSININGASNKKSLIIFIIYLLYILFQFKLNLFNTLCAILPFYTFSLISELIIGVILYYFCGFYQLTQTNSVIYNIGLFNSILLMLIFSFCFIKFIKYLKLNSFPIYCSLIFIFPLVTIFFLSTLNNYYNLINDTGTMLLIFLCILISNFSILIIFLLIIQSNKHLSDLKLAVYRESVATTKYNLLKNHYNNNFLFLHDLLHKCYQIKNNVETDDKEETKIVLDKLIDITFKRFNSIYTNSLALNYAVNSKLDELEKNEIHFISTIKYNDFSFLTLELQTEIFSKLLDYGIILNQSVPKKERDIIIKSQKIGQQIIISSLIKFDGNKQIDIQKEIADDFEVILYPIHSCNLSVKITDNNCISIIIYFIL